MSALVLAGTGAPLVRADQQAELVTINYPEQLPLEALVDYVSQSLDVRVVYGDELKNQHVFLRPGHIELPKDRLLVFLRSVLAMRGLALVEGHLPQFYQITPVNEAQRLVDGIQTAPPEAGAEVGRVVTQVIEVPSGDTKSIAGRIKDFTSSSKTSIIEIPERGTIILTDYEPVVARVMDLVRLIDAAPEPITTEVVPVSHQDTAALGKLVSAVLAAEGRIGGRDAPGVELTPGMAAGSVVVSGPIGRVARAVELLRQFDVSEEVTRPTQVYVPKHASAGRMKTLIERLVLAGGSTERRAADIFLDESFNRLYVTAPTGIQDRIRELLEAEDRPMPETSRRTRIYRPRNRPSGEILETLSQLLEEASLTLTSIDADNRAGLADEFRGAPGPNRPPATPDRVQMPPVPPAQEPTEGQDEPRQTVRRLEGPDYVLTEDEPTNSIIALGTPEFHAQLQELLAELDRRPAQVLIEMTLIAVTLSDSLNVGIELEALDLGGGTDYLLFTSFGLSSIDVMTGQRVLAPGVGGNGVLIRPDEIPVILRALATHGNSRVISSPRMLVSDNTSATLRNVEEAPFTSVNASDTVATTSFAGFESAGTTLTVTPHIAEGDHLMLNYNLTFSNFAGAAGEATVPPPRTTNSFAGDVQVPDGYTMIVGGLEVDNKSESVSEVPFIGRIPILGLLFQSNTASRTHTRIYAFIRPVILRDDQFADLKFISEEQLRKAEEAKKDFPPDQLMWMR